MFMVTTRPLDYSAPTQINNEAGCVNAWRQ